MNPLHIVVCVKQVPVSNNIKIDPVTKNLMRSAESGVMNPFDKNALEGALSLKDEYNAKVTVLSMGPPNFSVTLKEALAMGADDAILLSSRAFGGADTLATGYVLSQAIKALGDVNVVFLGRQSVDADTGQVGPIVAEFLNVPQVTYVSKINEVKNDKIVATRLLENMEQTIEVTLPAVFTVRSELNTPRYPHVRNIKLSCSKEVQVWDEHAFKVDAARIGVKGSPTIVRRVWTPEKVSKQSVSLGTTNDEAVQNLLIALRERNIV